MKRILPLLGILLSITACVSTPKSNSPDFTSIIQQYRYNTILYSTDFVDEESFKLILYKNQKIEPKKGYANVYGTSQDGGGSLIYMPFSLKYGTRIIIEFEGTPGYEFGFSLMERLNEQDEAKSFLIKQISGNIMAENWPWKKINANWETKGIELPIDKVQFRYFPGIRLLIIFEIDNNGKSIVKILNDENKEITFKYPETFSNVPLDFIIRGFGGHGKYYKLIIQEY